MFRFWVPLLMLAAAVPNWGADDDRHGDLSLNNNSHFAARGRGSSTSSSHGTQPLFEVTIDIDRGNRILVSFPTGRGQSLSFSGSVIAADGNTIKADVATNDSARLRGSMYLSRNPKGDIARITLDATNGQDRLSVDWKRR